MSKYSDEVQFLKYRSTLGSINQTTFKLLAKGAKTSWKTKGVDNADNELNHFGETDCLVPVFIYYPHLGTERTSVFVSGTYQRRGEFSSSFAFELFLRVSAHKTHRNTLQSKSSEKGKQSS